MTGTDRVEKKYFVMVAACIIAIGIFGALTAQVLVAAALIVMVAGCTIILNRYRGGTSIPAEDPEGGEAILAAVIVTIAGALVSQWLLWAVAIVALLLIQQSLSRIERRLTALEKP